MKIGKETHKLALYADGILIYLTSPESSMQHLLEVIKEYSIVSGYNINENKCESLSIGIQMNHSFKQHYKFKWDAENIRDLGISISKNVFKCIHIKCIHINHPNWMIYIKTTTALWNER